MCEEHIARRTGRPWQGIFFPPIRILLTPSSPGGIGWHRDAVAELYEFYGILASMKLKLHLWLQHMHGGRRES